MIIAARHFRPLCSLASKMVIAHFVKSFAPGCYNIQRRGLGVTTVGAGQESRRIDREERI